MNASTDLGPLGYCCDCLFDKSEKTQAVTIFDGYSVCRGHLTDRRNLTDAAEYERQSALEGIAQRVNRLRPGAR